MVHGIQIILFIFGRNVHKQLLENISNSWLMHIPRVFQEQNEFSWLSLCVGIRRSWCLSKFSIIFAFQFLLLVVVSQNPGNIFCSAKWSWTINVDNPRSNRSKWRFDGNIWYTVTFQVFVPTDLLTYLFSHKTALMITKISHSVGWVDDIISTWPFTSMITNLYF